MDSPLVPSVAVLKPKDFGKDNLSNFLDIAQNNTYATFINKSVEFQKLLDLDGIFRKLIKNIYDYIKRSTFTMIRMFIVYRPFRFFAIIGCLFLFPGLLLGLRFLYYYMDASGVGHIQSLILSAVLILTGVQICLIAVLADLLSVNRKLLEDIQTRLKKNIIR